MDDLGNSPLDWWNGHLGLCHQTWRKVPEVNGGFVARKSRQWGKFCIAIFDYWRVSMCFRWVLGDLSQGPPDFYHFFMQIKLAISYLHPSLGCFGSISMTLLPSYSRRHSLAQTTRWLSEAWYLLDDMGNGHFPSANRLNLNTNEIQWIYSTHKN